MLENLEPIEPNRTNRVDEILKQLDVKDQKILIDALNNPNWTANGLSNALRLRGIKLSQSTIARYRTNNKDK
jgi:hypothetical protein